MADVKDNARLVLRLVEERDMDGYTLMARSGLKLDELQQAVQTLLERNLLRVKGEVRGPRLAESWFQAGPSTSHSVSGLASSAF